MWCIFIINRYRRVSLIFLLYLPLGMPQRTQLKKRISHSDTKNRCPWVQWVHASQIGNPIAKPFKDGPGGTPGAPVDQTPLLHRGSISIRSTP